MADTSQDWRRLPPQTLKVVVRTHSCGWHVFLQRHTIEHGDRLRVLTIAKDCIPYKDGVEAPTALTQVQAMLLALWGMTEGIRPECNNL